MIRKFSLATVLVAAIALPAVAEDKKMIDPSGKSGPTETMSDQVPQMKQGAGTNQPATEANPNPAATSTAAANDSTTLSTQDALLLIDKPVYSSDGIKLGEVVAFQRDSSDKVTGMHADVGGFLGLGQHRINLTPAQFKVQGDRVVLEITSEQAKALPKVQE
jgi:hypothetical protein